jgi:hypothetical protein
VLTIDAVGYIAGGLFALMAMATGAARLGRKELSTP